MPDPLVICVRDPDYDNEFHVFGKVEVYDIDLGRSNLRDPDEYAQWSESHLEFAKEMRADGQIAAAEFVEQVVADQEPDNG